MEQAPNAARSLAEFFQDLWSQARVAVTGAEEEATKLLARVQTVAGWSQDEVRQQAIEFTEMLASQRREMERRVEASVKQSLLRSRLPRREELEKLRKRLDSLSARVEALSK
jgi:hypothetical protein